MTNGPGPSAKGLGMFGKPIPDCGCGGTSVPSFSFGTRLFGGFLPSVAHSSSAMNSARCTGAELSGLSLLTQPPVWGGVGAGVAGAVPHARHEVIVGELRIPEIPGAVRSRVQQRRGL